MKEKLSLYNNAAILRLHNKKITILKEDNVIQIDFKMICDDVDKPSCRHQAIKGKVRQTTLKISEEGMDQLVFAYLEYKNKSEAQ